MLYHIPPTNKIYKSPRDPPIASNRLSCSQKCTSVLLTCRSEPCILPLFFSTPIEFTYRQGNRHHHRSRLQQCPYCSLTLHVSATLLLCLSSLAPPSSLNYDSQRILQMFSMSTVNDECTTRTESSHVNPEPGAPRKPSSCSTSHPHKLPRPPPAALLCKYRPPDNVSHSPNGLLPVKSL